MSGFFSIQCINAFMGIEALRAFRIINVCEIKIYETFHWLTRWTKVGVSFPTIIFFLYALVEQWTIELHNLPADCRLLNSSKIIVRISRYYNFWNMEISPHKREHNQVLNCNYNSGIRAPVPNLPATVVR